MLQRRLEILWKYFLARFRLNREAICSLSLNRLPYDDFHDYPDSVEGRPEHFGLLTCKYCGKNFTL